MKQIVNDVERLQQLFLFTLCVALGYYVLSSLEAVWMLEESFLFKKMRLSQSSIITENR